MTDRALTPPMATLAAHHSPVATPSVAQPTATQTRSRRERRWERTLATGSGRTDRANRLLLTVVGVILTAAGALGALLASGMLRATAPGVIYHQLRAGAVGNADWSAAAATAICLGATAAGVRAAAAQLRPVGDGPRLARVVLPVTERGATTIPPSALDRAATADVGHLPGVASARVRLRNHRPPRASALVSIEMYANADLTLLATSLDAALGRLAAALDATGIDAEIRLRFARGLQPPGARVR